MREQGEKVAADKKSRVESAIAALREAVKSDDAAAMRSKLDALNTELQAVSSDLYSQAKSAREAARGGARGGPAAAEPEQDQGQGSAGRGGKAKDDVIDADFEMVDDDKKK
jgi:molecular chaperone DnaK